MPSLHPEAHEQSQRGTKDILTKAAILTVAATTLVSYIHGKNEASNLQNGAQVEYTVKPHDTEWGIAEKFYPSVDPREAVEIIDNQVHVDKSHPGSTIQPGDVISVPAP
jgi:nucleoid-associated protein YgaU